MKTTLFRNLLIGSGAFLLLCGSAQPGLAQTQITGQQPAQQAATPAETDSAPVKALRELHGVKLGMARAQVKAALGKPGQSADQMDEFKLNGGDLLTVRYDPQNQVNVIQLYCTDAGRAPAWTEVIGDATVEQKPNGSKHARKVVPTENFWVAMFQSQSGAVTTVTLSRQ